MRNSTFKVLRCVFSTKNYAERPTWEGEGALYGPITEDLGFLVSGKYVRRAPNFPAFLEYSQDWNYQGKLNYRLGSRNRFELSGLYQGFDNTEGPRLSYWSSEDAFVSGFWGPPPYYHASGWGPRAGSSTSISREATRSKWNTGTCRPP